MSNDSDNCFASTVAHFDDVFIGLVSTAVVAAVFCCIVIAILIITRAYKTFINRLILYLMFASLLHAIMGAIEMAPVHVHNGTIAVREGLDSVCVAVAFTVQNTVWTIHLFMFWAVLYLVLLAVFKYNANKRRHEVAGIVVSIVLPLSFNWIPFIDNMYGLAGMWCWIKLTQENCRSDYIFGVVYQFSLFYGPLVVLMLLSYISFVAIALVLCKHAIRSRRQNISYYGPSVHQQALKEALPLLIYPLLYHIFCAFMVANRIYYAIDASKGGGLFFPLWLAHAVAEPAQALFPPVAFLLHPGTMQKFICRRKQKNLAPTSYVVSREFPYSEEDPLIIRGSEEEQRDGSDYQSLLFEAGTQKS